MYMDFAGALSPDDVTRQRGCSPLSAILKIRRGEIFASYPRWPRAVMLDFIVDYLRLIISGNMNTFEN